MYKVRRAAVGRTGVLWRDGFGVDGAGAEGHGRLVGARSDVERAAGRLESYVTGGAGGELGSGGGLGGWSLVCFGTEAHGRRDASGSREFMRGAQKGAGVGKGGRGGGEGRGRGMARVAGQAGGSGLSWGGEEGEHRMNGGGLVALLSL